EHASMSARFDSLSDDRMASACFQPARLIHRGGRGNDLRTSAQDSVQQLSLWQPEVETDNFRAQLLNQCTKLLVERRTIGGGERCIRVQAELSIIGCQCPPPPRFPLIVPFRLSVAEKVDVDRLGRLLTDDAELR